MSAVSETVSSIVLNTTGVVTTRWYNAGADLGAPVHEFPLAERSEILDGRCCELCRSIDGRVMDRRDPRFPRWLAGVHISCRGTWTWIHRDELTGPHPTTVTWDAPPEGMTPVEWDAQRAKLIEKQGHFVRDEPKYTALNVPARPTGRDFIAYRRPGAAHVTLRWRDGLPDWAVKQSLRDMGSTMRNVASLHEPGDRELAQQILWHAAARGLFSSFPRFEAQLKALWPELSALSADQLRRLPAIMLDNAETTMGPVADPKRLRWALYHPDLAVGSRRADDIAVLYSPRDAAFTEARSVAATEEAHP
jgi:hypothetical protein